MNRIHSALTAFTLCLAATAMGQTNLLDNPGFESEGSGWNLSTQSGAVAVASVTYPNTGAHGGTRYARVVVTTPSADAATNWHVQFQPPTNWSAVTGATYEFKFWAKSDSSRGIHVSVQGSGYAYLTGQSFGLTPEWTEYSLTPYVATEEGTGAVRFHVYVAEFTGDYQFDDFSVVMTAPPVGIQNGVTMREGTLGVRQEAGNFVVSLGGGSSEKLSAELFDLRGTSVTAATGLADGSLRLARPGKSGTYFIRAKTLTHSWVTKVSVL